MQCHYFTNVPISCKNACMCVFVPFQHNIFYSLYVKQLQSFWLIFPLRLFIYFTSNGLHQVYFSVQLLNGPLNFSQSLNLIKFVISFFFFPLSHLFESITKNAESTYACCLHFRIQISIYLSTYLSIYLDVQLYFIQVNINFSFSKMWKVNLCLV